MQASAFFEQAEETYAATFGTGRRLYACGVPAMTPQEAREAVRAEKMADSRCRRIADEVAAQGAPRPRKSKEQLAAEAQATREYAMKAREKALERARARQTAC